MDCAVKLTVIAGLRNLLIVAPEKFREVVVGVALAVVTKEQVKALAVRVTTCPEVPESPLTDGSGGITLSLEVLGNGYFAIGDWVLSREGMGLGSSVLWVAVITDIGVSRMFAGHQHTTAGRAYRLTRVVLGEFNALGCYFVYMGSLDPFLPVTTQFGIPEVICQDENNVGFVSCSAEWHSNAQQESGQDQFHLG